MRKLSEYPFSTSGMMCYYFTASTVNALDIIKHSHLFGSFPSKVNDPKDLCVQIVGWERNKGWIPQGIDKAGFEQRLNDTLAQKGCMDRSMRILCMAEATRVDADARCQERFWNEYANCGNGVRFKFLVNQNFLIQPTAAEVLFEQVQYVGRTKTIDAARIRSDFDIAKIIGEDGFLRDLCFTKETKWSNEYEFRFCSTVTRLNLQMSEITSREERFYVFNPRSLVEVVVGKNVNEEEKCKLRLALRPFGLDLAECSI